MPIVPNTDTGLLEKDFLKHQMKLLEVGYIDEVIMNQLNSDQRRWVKRTTKVLRELKNKYDKNI